MEQKDDEPIFMDQLDENEYMRTRIVEINTQGKWVDLLVEEEWTSKRLMGTDTLANFCAAVRKHFEGLDDEHKADLYAMPSASHVGWQVDWSHNGYEWEIAAIFAARDDKGRTID